MGTFRSSSRRTIPHVGRLSAIWICVRVSAVAAVFLLGGATSVRAVPILAEVVSCTGGLLGTCTIEPISGPVDVDPLGFTLEVAWDPYLLFTPEPGGGSPQGRMNLFFTYTGSHDGTSNLGNITLLDINGDPIANPDVEFDDLNAVAGVVTAHYEIFGTSALLRGFTLALSDGSGVDSMQFTGASTYPTSLVPVPEPSVLLLFGAGLALAVRRRHR